MWSLELLLGIQQSSCINTVKRTCKIRWTEYHRTSLVFKHSTFKRPKILSDVSGHVKKIIRDPPRRYTEILTNTIAKFHFKTACFIQTDKIWKSSVLPSQWPLDSRKPLTSASPTLHFQFNLGVTSITVKDDRSLSCGLSIRLHSPADSSFSSPRFRTILYPLELGSPLSPKPLVALSLKKSKSIPKEFKVQTHPKRCVPYFVVRILCWKPVWFLQQNMYGKSGKVED